MLAATVVWVFVGPVACAADGPSHRALHPNARVFTPEQLSRALAAGPKERKPPAAESPASSAMTEQVKKFVLENPELAKSLLGLAAELARDNPELLNGRPEDISKNIAEELKKRPDLLEEAKKLQLPAEARELLKAANKEALGETPPERKKRAEELAEPADKSPFPVPERLKNWFPPSERQSKSERDREKSAKPEDRPHERTAEEPNRPGDLPRERPDRNLGDKPDRPKPASELDREMGTKSQSNGQPTDAAKPQPAPPSVRDDAQAQATAEERKRWDEFRKNNPDLAEKAIAEARLWDRERRNAERQAKQAEGNSGSPGKAALSGENAEQPPERGDGRKSNDLADILRDIEAQRQPNGTKNEMPSDKGSDGNANEGRAKPASRPDAMEPSTGERTAEDRLERKPAESAAKLLGEFMRNNPELVKSLAESAAKMRDEQPNLGESLKSAPAVKELVDSVRKELADAPSTRRSDSSKPPSMKDAAEAIKELVGDNEKGMSKSFADAAKDAAKSLAERSARAERAAASQPQAPDKSLMGDAKAGGNDADRNGGMLGSMASGAARFGEWAARQSRSLAESTPSGGGAGGRGFNPPAFSDLAAPSLAGASTLGTLVAAAVAVVAALYLLAFLRRKGGVAGTVDARATRVRMAALSLAGLAPREQATKLFEHTALAALGEPARPKHHLAVADELLPETPQHASELADHYEAARYTPPDDEFAPERVEAMRNLLRV